MFGIKDDGDKPNAKAYRYKRINGLEYEEFILYWVGEPKEIQYYTCERIDK